MKFFIVLLFAVAVPASLASYLPALDDVLHNFEKDCSKKSGLEFAQIEKIRENSRLVPLPEDNPLVNQWAKCMLQEYKIINSDETVNTNPNSLYVFDDTRTYTLAFPICKNKIGRDIADTARLVWDCYSTNSTMVMMAFTPCHNC